ncbi:unnamed protein product [Paramecium sonneborni]|uniref:Uncharacterized protein n=1 Tax=Paramecium sonneborni TaxID=65129 RepID=A0A8S1QWX9_9CILI|nr:unnamed protein product [Paramecium sonneborni]
MGNSQKNDQKLISTVWLGVNDDWPSIMKEKLSRISEEWSTPLLLSLNRFSFKEQNKFRNKIKAILTQKIKNEQYDELIQQSQIFLNNNEFLRQDIQLLNTGISDLTISTNYNSYKINDSQSISSKIENSIYVEDQNPQVQQFYVVFSCINDAFNSTRHPFIHFIIIFKEWTTAQFISIKNLQNNIQHIKQRLSKFQISSDLFLNFFIFSLNEYLGDFGEDLTEDSFNKYIKDKQNYFNLCLQHVIQYSTLDL